MSHVFEVRHKAAMVVCSADKPAAITAHMARENHNSGNAIIWPFYLIINLTIFDESAKLIGIFNNGDRVSGAFY